METNLKTHFETVTATSWRASNEPNSFELTRDTVAHESGQTVLIKMSAVALNFADMLKANNTYQKSGGEGYIAGLEGVGTIVEAQDPTLAGKRVLAVPTGEGRGVLTTHLFASPHEYFVIPDDSLMSDEEAASFHLVFQTAYLALKHNCKLKSGATLLINGASGSLGLALLQVAKLMELKSVAVTSSTSKAQLCQQYGADTTVLYEEFDRDGFTLPAEVDCFVDLLGGQQFHTTRRMLKPGATIISLGFVTGEIPTVSLGQLLLRNHTVIGFDLNYFRVNNPEMLQEAHTVLISALQNQQIRSLPHEVYDFDDFPKAFEQLSTKSVTNRTVIRVGEKQ